MTGLAVDRRAIDDADVVKRRGRLGVSGSRFCWENDA